MKFADKETELLAKSIVTAMKDDEPATCIELLRQLLPTRPTDNFWEFLYADKLRELGAIEEAERELLRLSKTYRDAELVAISLGRLYSTGGKKAQAEAWFKEATLIAPQKTAPWIYYGAFLSNSSRFEEAIAIFESGLKTSLGTLEEIYLNLALVCRALSRYEEALGYAKQAIKLSPEYVRAKAVLLDVEKAINVVRTMNP